MVAEGLVEILEHQVLMVFMEVVVMAVTMVEVKVLGLILGHAVLMLGALFVLFGPEPADNSQVLEYALITAEFNIE